jgi:hypothetical protein
MKYTGRISTYLRKILFFVLFIFVSIFIVINAATLSGSLLRGYDWRAIDNREVPNAMVGGGIKDGEAKGRRLRLLLRVNCEILENEIAVE